MRAIVFFEKKLCHAWPMRAIVFFFKKAWPWPMMDEGCARGSSSASQTADKSGVGNFLYPVTKCTKLTCTLLCWSRIWGGVRGR